MYTYVFFFFVWEYIFLKENCKNDHKNLLQKKSRNFLLNAFYFKKVFNERKREKVTEKSRNVNKNKHINKKQALKKEKKVIIFFISSPVKFLFENYLTGILTFMAVKIRIFESLLYVEWFSLFSLDWNTCLKVISLKTDYLIFVYSFKYQ